jgi:hypothetical protein
VLKLVRTTTAAKRLVKMEMTTHRFPRVERFGFLFQTFSFAFAAVLFVSPSGVPASCNRYLCLHTMLEPLTRCVL